MGKFAFSFTVLIGVLSVFFQNGLFAQSEPAQSTANDPVETAIAKAGENAAQLRAAIDATKSNEAEQKCIRFLIANMPDKDLKVLTSDFLVSNTRLALKARGENKWAQSVPWDIFLNDVLPYASINEKRENWRADFYKKFAKLVKDCESTGEAAQILNKNVFKVVNVRYSTKRKKPDQSPSESMETGLASCTGLSVILVDACRAVGVPARLAGTPLWVNKRGNHTWVEVWDGGHWKFTGACEYDPNGLNRGWFAGIASQADAEKPIHRIYATSFRKTDQHFPMVWKWNSQSVPGVDVTWRYKGEKRKLAPGEKVVAIQPVDADGKRVQLKLALKSGMGSLIGTGKSRNESNDANDLLEFQVKPGNYVVELTWEGKSVTHPIIVKDQVNQVFRISLDPSKKN